MLLRKVSIVLVVALAMNLIGVPSDNKTRVATQSATERVFDAVSVRYEKIDALPAANDLIIEFKTKEDLAVFKKEGTTHARVATSELSVLTQLREFVENSVKTLCDLPQPQSKKPVDGSEVVVRRLVKFVFPGATESVVARFSFMRTSYASSNTECFAVKVVVYGITSKDVHGMKDIIPALLQKESAWKKCAVGSVVSLAVVGGGLLFHYSIRRIQKEHAARSADAEHGAEVVACVEELRKSTATKDGEPVNVHVHNLDVEFSYGAAASVVLFDEYDPKALHIFVSSKEKLLEQEMKKVAYPVGVHIDSDDNFEDLALTLRFMLKDKLEEAIGWDDEQGEGQEMYSRWTAAMCAKHQKNERRYAPHVAALETNDALKEYTVPMVKDLFGIDLTFSS